MKKRFLYDVLGFTGITHNSTGNPEHQASVAVKKNFQSACIVRLQTGHCLFIRGNSCFGDMRGTSCAFLARVPHNWKCKSASWGHRTHALDSNWTDVAILRANTRDISKLPRQSSDA